MLEKFITMPAYAWEALLQRLDGEERAMFEKQGKENPAQTGQAIAGELKKG
jgi:hypothetical protein